jgi:hypothetical protein
MSKVRQESDADQSSLSFSIGSISALGNWAACREQNSAQVVSHHSARTTRLLSPNEGSVSVQLYPTLGRGRPNRGIARRCPAIFNQVNGMHCFFLLLLSFSVSCELHMCIEK